MVEYGLSHNQVISHIHLSHLADLCHAWTQIILKSARCQSDCPTHKFDNGPVLQLANLTLRGHPTQMTPGGTTKVGTNQSHKKGFGKVQYLTSR